MQRCVLITRRIRKILFAISALFIAAASAIASINAILRFCGVGFGWADELYTYLVVLMVYLALAHLEGTGDQLCITAIDSLVKSKKGQTILNYIRGIITSAALITLGYYGINVTMKAFQRHQVTYILQLPKGILYAIAMACLLITVLVWLVIMICNKGQFDTDQPIELKKKKKEGNA